MTITSNAFSTFVFLASLLAAMGVTSASAGAIIEWVTPPAWLQTETEDSSAMPGKSLNSQSWITTGRGGRALIRVGQEQIEIDENSVWEWSGLDDGGTGNTIQGQMRVSTSQASVTSQPQTTAADQALRFYRKAPWILLLDAGDDPDAALHLVDFLRNSGFPIKSVQQVQQDSTSKLQIWFEGLPSKDAATSLGSQLRALAPAILSTTPELKVVLKLTDPKW